MPRHIPSGPPLRVAIPRQQRLDLITRAERLAILTRAQTDLIMLAHDNIFSREDRDKLSLAASVAGEVRVLG